MHLKGHRVSLKTEDIFAVDSRLGRLKDELENLIRYGFETTWNALFAAVAPLMLDETSEAIMLIA